MNLDLEIEFSKAPILEEVAALKKQIDDLRPLPADVEGRVMQKLRLDWNYNSNAIEGNKLSYGETVAFLMEGITAKGKPLKDHLDIRGHNEAINFLLSLVKDLRSVSEADIRALHEMILVEPYEVAAQTADGQPTKKLIKLGEYKTMSNHVETATGEIHYYATPDEVPLKMRELIEWYREANSYQNIHPIVVAALFHYKFVSIHPFDDGNGRLSRILMNLVLMQKGYQPVIVKMDDRKNYYSLLSRADSGEIWPFIEYIAEREQSSLELYLKGANGRDIDEDEDIDKEIILLKMQLNGGMVLKEKKSVKSIENIFDTSIGPLALKLNEKSKNFHDYFFSNQNWIRFYYLEGGDQKSTLEWISDKYLEAYKKILTDSKKDIYEIIIELGYREYRNPDNNFNLLLRAEIKFDKYYYRILVDNEVIVSNPYHQELSRSESDSVVKAIIGSFKYQLNKNTKSPES